MKKILIVCLCVAGVIGLAKAQPAPTTPAVSPTATVSASASASPESQAERAIRNKLKKHFSFTIDDHDIDATADGSVHHKGGADEIPEFVVPLVGIVFMSIFGAPVLIVAVILYFGFSKSRMQHKTIRMLVEKGQPVPAELLAPPTPIVRQRSDMRRGVVWTTVGAGAMLFFGAVNDWEGGAWAIGLIPFFIGLGFLVVWKMEGGKSSGDKPPPLP